MVRFRTLFSRMVSMTGFPVTSTRGRGASMAKIVWSVPLLQYGKFLIEATPEELGVDIGSPHSMAMAYAVYAQLAAKGYDEGLKMDVDVFIGKPGHVTDRYQESSEKEPRSDHRHVYTWADDGNGHEGSFCEC